MARMVSDCRDFPGSNCTLMIAGEEAEVLRAAVEHAVSAHGYPRTPDLENEIRKSLKEEVPIPMAASAPAQELPKSH